MTDEALNASLEETKELLREAGIRRARTANPASRDDIAKALFDEIATLHGYASDLHVGRPDPWELLIGFGAVRLLVSYSREGGFHMTNPAYVQIPLDYDPIARKFVGTTLETWRTPVPGSPVQRRSAAAVIVEAALAIIAPTT